MILYIIMNQKLRTKFSVLKKVVKFFYGRYTFWVLLRDILFIAITAAEMFSISIMGDFLDATAELLTSGASEFSLTDYITTDSFFYLMLMLLLWMIVNIGSKVRDNVHHNIEDKMWADCNFEIMKKVSNSNLQDVMDQNFQDLVAYVPTHSINNLMLSYLAFSDIVSQFIRLVSAVVILFVDLRWSILFLVLFVLPEVIIGHIQRKKIRNYNEKNVDNLKLIRYIFNLSLDNRFFGELRVDNTYRKLKEMFKKENEKYQKGLFYHRKHFYIDVIATSVFGQVFKYGYVIYLIGYSIAKQITIGAFSALFNYVRVVYSSAFHVLNTIAILSNRLAYTEDFFELIDWEGFGDASYGSKKIPNGSVDLMIDDLDFAYPDEPNRLVLKDITLEIKNGEKVAFYGGDSSGKSSLVKILTGMFAIHQGDYLINGISVKDLRRKELKSRISVVFQDFVNYNLTLEENITIGLARKNVDRKLLKEVLKITELDKFLKENNLDEECILGRNYVDGLELSPGYWQRVAIARMLYRNKDVFIMDEPFTFIDTGSKHKILKGVFDFMSKEQTLIYITRSAEELEAFDKIFYFDNGRLKEEGSWKELMKKRGEFYKSVKGKK